MNASKVAPLLRRAAFAGSLALMAAGAAVADPITLAPQYAGQYGAGNGVDAIFLKVKDAWHDSTVLWTEPSNPGEKGTYGAGRPIGDFSWGTGLWGLADWQTANRSNPPTGMIEGSWSGRVGQISFGDDKYNSEHGGTWGAVAVAPLFGPGSTLSSQDNWTSHFGGYIRITEAGLYNFSVLHDDGFFFKLHGGGNTLEMSHDFLNPRDRVGFGSDLWLSEGLYGFELGAYERILAGVVELAWSRGDKNWTPVPTEHLVASVPEPGSFALMAGSLLLLAAARRNRRNA